MAKAPFLLGAAFVAVGWGIGRLLPMPLLGRAGDWAALALVLAGGGLMLGAVVQRARARTTVIPHRQPQALVTRGVFRLSRNPIYLADAGFLLAAVLWLDVALALPLVPVFMLVIRQRFIRSEEARLRAGFGPEFENWAARTRRWI